MRLCAIAAGLVLASAGAAAADGQSVFDANCAVCHQGGGVGVPGQFPRLAGRAGAIASKPDGKAFLPQVLLNGIGGRIMVDDEQILGVMPSFDSLSDSDLAAVLTYITGLGHKPIAYTPADIKTARSKARKSPGEMAALHTSLAAKKVIP